MTPIYKETRNRYVGKVLKRQLYSYKIFGSLSTLTSKYFYCITVLTFLGFAVNSSDVRVKLTPDKANYLREACTKLLNTQHPTIRDVAQVIGLMVSSAPAVELCMLFLPNTGE